MTRDQFTKDKDPHPLWGTPTVHICMRKYIGIHIPAGEDDLPSVLECDQYKPSDIAILGNTDHQLSKAVTEHTDGVLFPTPTKRVEAEPSEVSTISNIDRMVSATLKLVEQTHRQNVTIQDILNRIFR